MEFLFILFAFGGGAILSCQQVMNAALGNRIGNMSSSFINHLVGALFAGGILALGFKTGPFHLSGIPFIYFLGGCLGVLTVAMSNFAIPHIGVVMFALLATSFQLLASLLVDHWGWLGAKQIPFSGPHAVGMALLILGAAFIFIKEKPKSPPATLEENG
ncbi:MAG: DMT family transporter [Deltaproteobacteria bacterium]|nr:DMT family transporter [Deltaproteobacteria bacterium]